MAVIFEHPRRTLNPEVTALYGRPTFPMSRLVKYSPTYGWARLFNFPYHGSYWRPRMHTVVLSIDGSCKIKNASDPASRAAYGVYFGPNDPKNISGLVQTKHRQTNSRAELEALREALAAIQRMSINGDFVNEFNPFKEIIIRLTSQYVTNAFSRDVWNWERNGWKTVNGKNVAHAELIEQIHLGILDMEQSMCMAVRLWKTERDSNAEKLAK